MEIPPELVREIVYRFSRAEDLGTLQAASLVSSAFRKPCQEVIFSELKVNKQNLQNRKNNTAHHLAGLDILRQNSALLSSVKAVSVQQSPDGFIVFDREPMESSMTDLIQLFATAPIERFSFVGWEGQTTLELQQGIVAIVRSPQLISLSLTFAPLELVSLVESLHLQHLVVKSAKNFLARPRAKCLFLAPFPSPSTRQRISLTSLKLTPDIPTINLLTGQSSIIDLSAVKELSLGFCQDSPGNIDLLMEHCAPSLRQLRMGGYPFTALRSLSQLRQLERLTVQEEDIWDERNPHANLPSFLDALPSPNCLSYIELERFYGGNHQFPGSAGFWALLDSELANRSKFAKLNTLKFANAVLQPPKPTPEEWEAKKRGYWPALRRAGVAIEMPRDFRCWV